MQQLGVENYNYDNNNNNTNENNDDNVFVAKTHTHTKTFTKTYIRTFSNHCREKEEGEERGNQMLAYSNTNINMHPNK